MSFSQLGRLLAACGLALCFCQTAPARVQQRFTEGWRFHLGDLKEAQAPELNDASWRPLDLPHDWSAEAAFSPNCASSTGFLPGGIGWYRKTFTLPTEWQGQRVVITFDGVYRDSDVWLNGQHLGHRPSGYISFEYDLTPHLRWGQTNTLAVRVERENAADSRWYPGSGIYRQVWLTALQPVHVAQWGTFVTTPRVTEQNADVSVATEVVNQTTTNRDVTVVWQIAGPDGQLQTTNARVRSLAAGEAFTFTQWQPVARPRLWSLDSPVLYQLVTRVYLGEQLVDETTTPFGIRRFHFDSAKGFFLNGQNLKLKGVCIHHDAGVVGTAVPAGMLERRLRLVKELGANAIRCSHNPMAPELYDLCDRLGLLVMDEAFDEWELGKHKWIQGWNAGTASRFGYSKDFAEWAERDCADMVRRDRNHPSIILWSLGNEIDYADDPYVNPQKQTGAAAVNDREQPPQTRLAAVAPRLVAAAKRYDPTRPLTMALANLAASDATGLAEMLDVVGYNYQESLYVRDHQLFPGRRIYGSENGKGLTEWQSVTDNDFVAGQFLWLSFDFLGESGRWPDHGSHAGLFDTCGFKKPAAWQRQALWSAEPMVALAVARPGEEPAGARRRAFPQPHWTWPVLPNQPLTVTAFCNCDEVELFLNDRSVGTQPVGAARTAVFQVRYAPGVLRAVARRAGQVAALTELKTAGEPARLNVELDRSSLQADGQSVVHAVISVVDEQGTLVYAGTPSVTAEAQGSGRLLGLDNGDLADTTPLRSLTKRLYHGQALAILQAGLEPGELKLTLTAPGLPPAQVVVPVK